jgi:hypothetical protein
MSTVISITDTGLGQRLVNEELNALVAGWGNYFSLGPVSKAYRAVDAHCRYRLRQWLCAKHQHQGAGTCAYPDGEAVLRKNRALVPRLNYLVQDHVPGRQRILAPSSLGRQNRILFRSGRN